MGTSRPDSRRAVAGMDLIRGRVCSMYLYFNDLSIMSQLNMVG